VAFACFEYVALRTRQNALEWALLLLVSASLPSGCTPLFVMDRGYARAALLTQLRQAGIPYLIRGRRNTLVRLAGQRLILGRVPYQQGVAVRYPHVLYQSSQREPVALIIFHDPTFKEPWYLLVPPDSHRQLPTGTVLALYRQRMHIELTFRDWKTHLGIRGLRLEVDIASRLERLLLALSVAYTLAVLLGAGPAARSIRQDCEVLRSTPRHGTRRRLSALTVGILLLSLTRFATLAARALLRLLAALARGTPAATLAVCPP
jgi:Transposase DDE domain